jgi:adenylosuccinate synthase
MGNRKISAVIGCNWGDEGKGLITDYLSSPGTLVVRYNGGSQAGHTVVTLEGKRHVFHHIGSGSFASAKTFLSEYFVVNPIIFYEEMKSLATFRVEPMVYVDRYCRVTTPYDILVNQALEKKRGDNKYGSCGLGFNETIKRSLVFPFFFYDLLKPRVQLKQSLFKIRDKYILPYIKSLNLELSDLPYLFDDKIIENYLDDIRYMLNKVRISRVELLANWSGDIVFEGAQGLQLDMDNWQFPHVTRSRTGLSNILNLLQKSELEENLDVYFVTRTYITRHGAGPLPHEYATDEYLDIVDETNIENEHQGKMRFSWLDLDYLKREITSEMGKVKGKQVTFNLAMTCVDQLKSDEIRYVQNSTPATTTDYELFKLLKGDFNFKSFLAAYGPSWNHILKI